MDSQPLPPLEQAALDMFDGRLVEDDNLVKISFRPLGPVGEIVLTFRDPDASDWVPASVDIYGVTIPVRKEVGPPLTDLVAKVALQSDSATDNLLSLTELWGMPGGAAIGGIPCFNETFTKKTKLLMYGTAGLFAANVKYTEPSTPPSRMLTI